MVNRKSLTKDTFMVKYSSTDGRNYGVMAMSYCVNEDQAIQKTKKELMRTNPKAVNYNYTASRG